MHIYDSYIYTYTYIYIYVACGIINSFPMLKFKIAPKHSNISLPLCP